MPGRVVTLLAAEGEEVAAGQGVLVLEAMKMENEIRAEHGGTVTKIHGPARPGRRQRHPRSSSSSKKKGLAVKLGQVSHRTVVLLLLGAFAILCMHGLVWDTPTVDEFAHLPAGYYYLKTGDFNLYSRNPPLLKILFRPSPAGGATGDEDPHETRDVRLVSPGWLPRTS